MIKQFVNCLILLAVLLFGSLTQNVEAAYDTKPFDISATRLPKKYQGHDIEKIFSNLRKKRNDNYAGKGEYETLEKYKLRIESEKFKPILGKILIGDFIAIKTEIIPGNFEREPNKFNAPMSGYNIDNKSLYITLPFAPSTTLSEESIIVKRKSKGNKYLGMNSFGASTYISNDSHFFYALTVKNVKDLNTIEEGKYDRYIEATLQNIEPEKAKKLKGKISAIYLVSISEPYDDVYSYAHQATISSPSADEYYYYKTYVNISKIIIYYEPSGEILTTLDYK